MDKSSRVREIEMKKVASLDILLLSLLKFKKSRSFYFTNHLKNKRIPSKVDLLQLITLQFEVAVLCSLSRKYDKRNYRHTTKKWGYPSVFKTAGIALKAAGIGSKFLSQRYFSQRFKPLAFECGDRVTRTYTSAFQKRWDRSRRFQTLFRRFYLCWDSLYENMNITYTSVFTTCASAFESAGICHSHKE